VTFHTSLQQSIQVTGHVKAGNRTVKLFSGDTSIEHSPSFLLQLEIFLQLSVLQFLALLLQQTAQSFVSLKLDHHT
jgi:hypothetical protein